LRRWVAASSFLISTGRRTLASTVRQSSSTSRWNTMATLPTAPLTRAPSTSIVPVVGGISPDTSISNVLLPQPLGPTIETNSPAAIARSISASACTSSPRALA
jgi:hypothetical protein